MNRRRFEGRRAFVIGGSGDIGGAICSLLAAEGAEVWIGCHEHPDRGRTLERQVREGGGKASLVSVDVRRQDSMDAAFASVCGSGRGLDVLVYAAGRTHEDLMMNISEAEWTEIVDINLNGAFRAIRAFGPRMMAERKGAIVLLGSITANRPWVGNSPYAVAKAGLEHLARVAAIEMGTSGVRVNVVSAGPIDAGLYRRSFGASMTESHRVTPLRRLGTAAEVAAMVAFVASDEASFSTGSTFVLDGGISIPASRPPARAPKSG